MSGHVQETTATVSDDVNCISLAVGQSTNVLLPCSPVAVGNSPSGVTQGGIEARKVSE